MRRTVAWLILTSCGEAEVNLRVDLGPSDQDGSGRDLTDGNAAADTSPDLLLQPLAVEAGEDFIAPRPAACLEFGPEEEIAGARYAWEIIAYPAGDPNVLRFHEGQPISGFPCSCSCPAQARFNARTCFSPGVGTYTFALTVSRGSEEVYDEVAMLVPPVLRVYLNAPEMEVRLHFRQAGAPWGSDDDAALHNPQPDWGEPRPPPGETCTKVDFCQCNQGLEPGWCRFAPGGLRCQDIRDDPIYVWDNFDGDVSGEYVELSRPFPGFYEIGVENQTEIRQRAQLSVRWVGLSLANLELLVSPSTAETPVALVGVLEVPVGEEGWWAGATFQETTTP